MARDIAAALILAGLIALAFSLTGGSRDCRTLPECGVEP